MRVDQKVEQIINDKHTHYFHKLKQLADLSFYNTPGGYAALQAAGAFVSLDKRHPNVSPAVFDMMQRCIIHPLGHDRKMTNNLDYYVRERSRREMFPVTERWSRLAKKECAEAIMVHDNRWYFYGGVFSEDMNLKRLFTLAYDVKYRPTREQRQAFAEAIRLVKEKLESYHRNEQPYGLNINYAVHRMTLEEFQSDAGKTLYSYTVFREVAITVSHDKSTGLRSVTFIQKGGKVIKVVKSSIDPLTPESIDAIIAKDPYYFNRNDWSKTLGSIGGEVSLKALSTRLDLNTDYGREMFGCIRKHITGTLLSFSGNWLYKLLAYEFGLPAPEKQSPSDKPLTMNKYISLSHPTVRLHVFGKDDYQICTWYQRLFYEEPIGYVIQSASTGMTYHADTVKECVAGLINKAELSTLPAEESETLTLNSVRRTFGFCAKGIKSFCRINGLDWRKTYTRHDIKRRIREHRDANLANFDCELTRMGLI